VLFLCVFFFEDDDDGNGECDDDSDITSDVAETVLLLMSCFFVLWCTKGYDCEHGKDCQQHYIFEP